MGRDHTGCKPLGWKNDQQHNAVWFHRHSETHLVPPMALSDCPKCQFIALVLLVKSTCIPGAIESLYELLVAKSPERGVWPWESWIIDCWKAVWRIFHTPNYHSTTCQKIPSYPLEIPRFIYVKSLVAKTITIYGRWPVCCIRVFNLTYPQPSIYLSDRSPTPKSWKSSI